MLNTHTSWVPFKCWCLKPGSDKGPWLPVNSAIVSREAGPDPDECISCFKNYDAELIPSSLARKSSMIPYLERAEYFVIDKRVHRVMFLSDGEARIVFYEYRSPGP